VDWRNHFVGEWALRRRIDDRLSGRAGRASGRAAFIPRGADLVCREEMRVCYGGRSLDAHQETVWRFADDGGVALLFSDGAPFCALRFRQAAGVWRASLIHDCPPDRYCGEAAVIAPDRWRLSWRALGPRKDYALDTDYRRLPRP
jgi:hypothetical protein